MSEWLKSLVNYRQQPDERRLKYALCRALGDNSYQCMRRRDWRWNKIARAHGYSDFETMKNILLQEEGFEK